MDNKNIFAENLRYYMEINGKSRRDVSEAIGVSYYTFTDWVKGKKYPRMDKVEKLATYFDIQKSDLIEDKKWASKEVRKEPQWKKFTSLISESYTAEDIKWFFEQKENSDKENLSAYGSEACGLFRIKVPFDIEPHPLQVGIVRARNLKNKMVVFGKVEEGIFRKNDKVKLDMGGNIIETTVLEAFVFDPDAYKKHDMYANFNDTIAANLRYTRKIKENRLGWLILDVGLLGVLEGDLVIKTGGK